MNRSFKGFLFRGLISITGVFFLLSACSSEPILRENINDIKKIHIVSAVIALPDHYAFSGDDQKNLTAHVELQCNKNYELDVQPKRWNWDITGTCKDCNLKYEFNPATTGLALSRSLEAGLRAGQMSFASESATNGLEGVSSIQKKIKETFSNGMDTDDWDEGAAWDTIAESPEMNALLASNPDEAFLFVVIHAAPEKGGRVIQKGKEDRFEACQRVVTVTPAADAVHFSLNAKLDLRYHGRPGTNLLQNDLNESVSEKSPLVFELQEAKPATLTIDWDRVEISQESAKKSDAENLFEVTSPVVSTNGLETAALKSLNGPARDLGALLSGKIKDYFDTEKAAAPKK